MLQIPPELDIFSRLVIARGNDARWIGEIDDSQRWMQNNEEFIQIHALGMANALRDNPGAFSYVAETLQQIGQALIVSGHGVTMGSNNWLVGVIDADSSQMFPDNPAGTWSPSYDEKNLEEILQDITTFGSSNSVIYTWGSEAHPANKDSQGFPTVRLFVRQRDTQTTHYQASVVSADVEEYNFGRNAQYAYNHVVIDYNNGSSGIAQASAVDPRIDLTLSTTIPAQGTAPFRYRKLARDYSGITTVGSSQASSIAQTYVNQYQNPTNKGTVKLRAVRDGNGAPIPLDALSAGHNILIPDLAQPVPSLGSTVMVTAIPGINQFYIVACQWQEDNKGPYVTLQLDNFADRAATLIARLILSADVRARSTKQSTSFVFGPGIPDTVTGGGTTVASAAAQAVSWAFTWHAQMSHPPTSTTTTTISLVNGNAASEFVNNLSVYGGNIGVNSTAAGAVTYLANITSHGNTLVAVDPVGNTIDWHCDQCNTLHTALPMVSALTVWAGLAGDPNLGKGGSSDVCVTCPNCGGCEHFNTALTQADATVIADAGRQQIASLILALLATPFVTSALATQVAAALPPPPV